MLKNAVALTVAGSDSGGGAGIQADLKTFAACGVYGASVITAVTAQNLEGVRAIQAIRTNVVEAQLRAVLEGFPVRAIKTGMLFNRGIIEVIAAVLKDHSRIPLVVDPVFAATSGSRLIKSDAIRVLCERLFPLAALVTPNVPEAEFLCTGAIRSLEDLHQAGRLLFDHYGVPFLMKGGHLHGAAVRKAASPRAASSQEAASPWGAAVRKAASPRAASSQEAASPWGTAVDLLLDEKGALAFEDRMVKGVNSHGSGCTFAAAIAAGLARGRPLRRAVADAKAFISGSLKRPHALKPGTNVIDHFFRWR